MKFLSLWTFWKSYVLETGCLETGRFWNRTLWNWMFCGYTKASHDRFAIHLDIYILTRIGRKYKTFWIWCYFSCIKHKKSGRYAKNWICSFTRILFWCIVFQSQCIPPNGVKNKVKSLLYLSTAIIPYVVSFFFQWTVYDYFEHMLTF